MNEKVTVLTLEDNIDYAVLEKIQKDGKEYVILFEEEHPQNIQVAEIFAQEETYVELIHDEEEQRPIFEEFFKRHPEFLK